MWTGLSQAWDMRGPEKLAGIAPSHIRDYPWKESLCCQLQSAGC